MKNSPVVFILIALCIAVFVGEYYKAATLFEWLALWPLDVSGVAFSASLFHPWQLVTYAFLHGGVLHIALNLYALWMFGVPLERRWGSLRFAVYFFACVVGAGLMHLGVGELFLTQGAEAHPVVGASGGVFGLLLGFGLLYPEARLMLLIPPVPIKALWFVIIYGLVELVAGVTHSAEGIAHFAHLGGMLTGFLLLRGSGWWR